MALLKGEGTHQILYGSADIFSGLRHNRGYLARPDHAGAHPAVLLAHGRKGLSSAVKSFARRLARHGFAVVAPDLYRGTKVRRQDPPPWPAEQQARADLRDAVAWMYSADTPFIRAGTIGLLALDDAGPPALGLAQDDDDAVGGLVLVSPPTGGPAETVAPILGFFGKDDEDVVEADRTAIQESLGHAEWVLYGGIGGGLVDESAPDYRWEVTEDLVDRTVSFLERVLEA